ncbi:MAG TPA: PaaI family thioesterase [Desulfobacterales bacterium]
MFAADRNKRREALLRLFSRAPIQQTFGMQLHYNEHDQAVFLLPHNPLFEHAMKDLHGGAIATLVDNAGWFTAAVRYQTWIATVELQVRLLEPARRKNLRAVGRLLRAGKNLAVTDMEVRTQSSGRLVAVGAGTFSVTRRNTETDKIQNNGY